MKLNEKIRITEERLNSDERSYERLIMCFLVGSYKAAPGYRMEILSSRETSYETFAVEVSVYMPRKKAAYATFVIELSSMDIQLAGTQDAPKMIYYRGTFEEYKENDYTAYCAAADFMNRMEQAAQETKTAVQDNDTAQETESRIDISAFCEKYVQEYGFLKDNGDNVAGFAEAVKAFDAFTENENNAAFVREFCERMGDYITSDREAAAFMFTLESMTAPPMCETEPEASETVSEAGQPAQEADEPALTNTPDGLKFHGHEVTGWVRTDGVHKFAAFAEAKEWAANERDCELVDDREDDAA